ncbi:uncharacterized protein F5891DRAFT_1049100 [Suillus fuscotomentosus]|uniref:Uncharacterized protein n=1 Tax=Suillus fuscotomentosus TaxID=1912939 RepID=A0AAD4E0M1_9AGAM|nr:uncharacterized protein F5891DRAFT_1049100 [Suillus fuscotomentosus]KAG1897365.1 hypothetical protein F5891DRAFT_1049100 [Suillus fuscotomentosus]
MTVSSAALRSISISCKDSFDGVNGSARFSSCPRSALASVSGLITARLAGEHHPARATIEVHVRQLSSVPGTADKFRYERL